MSSLKNIKISKPTYREVVPSSKEQVHISPFKVGDEKVLLMASESKDNKQMIDAMKQIITNNVEGVDVEDLAPYDMEYLFLKLRSISVGETSKVSIHCDECEEPNEVEIDLTTVKVEENENHTNIIKFSDELAFKMKWADLEAMATLSEDVDSVLDLVVKSVDIVYWGDETIKVGPAEESDLRDLINQLTTKQFAEIQKFFETVPKLRHNISFECKKCQHENKKVLEGLTNFF